MFSRLGATQLPHSNVVDISGNFEGISTKLLVISLQTKRGVVPVWWKMEMTGPRGLGHIVADI